MKKDIEYVMPIEKGTKEEIERSKRYCKYFNCMLNENPDMVEKMKMSIIGKVIYGSAGK